MASPVATTEKVAVAPTLIVCDAGCVVIEGAVEPPELDEELPLELDDELEEELLLPELEEELELEDELLLELEDELLELEELLDDEPVSTVSTARELDITPAELLTTTE